MSSGPALEAAPLTDKPPKILFPSESQVSVMEMAIGVTLSRGCVDRGGNALKVHSYTHILQAGVFRGLGSWLRRPGLMARNGGHDGSIRVSQIGPGGGSGTPEDDGTGPAGTPPATPFHP
ncbi:hypothetical protein KUCAC02_001208 [Chaenocephalus aceratus]|uniref:Uncharacterized protein n=1 Tax=Chaenocephalus aceratus TaxID=36190 RepID=A0ACB9XVH3_CHAAC|nr:hypothetical protein KUCAC02_001208 [Chaenocephalus aceratus]